MNKIMKSKAYKIKTWVLIIKVTKNFLRNSAVLKG